MTKRQSIAIDSRILSKANWQTKASGPDGCPSVSLLTKGIRFLLVILVAQQLFGCGEDPPKTHLLTFSEQRKVEVSGYTGNLMEPFLSPDGTVLFFNNLNSPPENTNLHWATRIDAHTFQYKGELAGVNTGDLEGVATMDGTGNFYFVSTRDYGQTLASVFKGSFNNGTVSSVSLVSGISKSIPGWLNFDVEVDQSGKYLYLVDGRFDQNGGPYEADLFIAEKEGTKFKRMDFDPFGSINTQDLEYAACISHDNLEMYFTRLTAPITSTSEPHIYGTYRESVDGEFVPAVRIEAITGFVEGPTLTPDGNTLYFHKAENGKFVLYSVIKTGL